MNLEDLTPPPSLVEAEDVAATAHAGDGEAQSSALGSAILEQAAGASVVIGQASGSEVLNRPSAGQEIFIPAGRSGSYVLGFDPGAAQVSTEGDNLVLSFGSDGGRLVFSDFAGAVNSGTAPSFQYGGQTVAGQSLYGQAQSLGDSSLAIEAAAGPGPGTLGSGTSSYDDNLGSVINLLSGNGVIEATAGEIGGPEIPENDVVEEILLFEEEEEPEEPPEDGGEYGGEYGEEIDPSNEAVATLASQSFLGSSDGDDTVTGGGETLTGEDGPDSFVLEGDAAGGTITIENFDADEGDSLDLTALLTGVEAETGPGLVDHLSFAFGEGDTTLTIDGNGAAAGGDTTTLVLRGSDLSGLGDNDAGRIQALLDSNTLDAV